jgi:hypothetical protein
MPDCVNEWFRDTEMTAPEATSIGQDALIWLAGEPEALARFLSLSGLSPEMLRDRISDPDFLGFVLEFLLGDERMVLAFAAASGHRPEDPGRARVALGGGELPNWT